MSKRRVLGLIASLVLALSLMVPLTACNNVREQVANVRDSVLQAIQGDVSGDIGKEYQTKWFTFSILEISHANTYAGLTPASGNEFIVIKLTEKNTTSISQVFGTFDWFVDAPSFSDYVYPLDPSPSDSTMMPLRFDLKPNESATYICVFEVPRNTQGLQLVYIELDDQDKVYGTFTIDIK